MTAGGSTCSIEVQKSVEHRPAAQQGFHRQKRRFSQGKFMAHVWEFYTAGWRGSRYFRVFACTILVSLLSAIGIGRVRAANAGSPARQGVALDEVALDEMARQRVLDAVIANIKKYYFDKDAAQKTAAALLAHAMAGDDHSAADGEAFSALLTRQMREASHDMHLELVYSEDRLPEHPPVETPEARARYRRAVEQEHCMFRKAEILPHNIGYLKLDGFIETSICQSTAMAAMAALNNANAIVIDLRDNRGGMGDMVMVISSYLFDHPEYMYSPREAPNEESWTRSPIPGNKLSDKPVYILTSASTWSAAECFSYDLKMLRRATLVGETTRGGAHAGVFHRVDDHFGMGIPEVRAINPFGKADWEGVGVEPDMKVKAADALEAAEKLAESRLKEK
jgi:C-terminal processing protease CtpA/Prc